MSQKIECFTLNIFIPNFLEVKVGKLPADKNIHKL